VWLTATRLTKCNTLHADLRIKIQAAVIAALLLLLTAPSRGSFIFCFIFSFAAHANNIIVNGTRFIYPGNEKEITVRQRAKSAG
jgi:P pilus assembly chaperone PapD